MARAQTLGVGRRQIEWMNLIVLVSTLPFVLKDIGSNLSETSHLSLKMIAAGMGVGEPK